MTPEREKAEQALSRLADSDEQFGKRKAMRDCAKETLKTAFAMAYLDTDSSEKVDVRKALAQTSSSYKLAIENHDNIVALYEILHVQRITWQAEWEDWRSVNSARGKGLVL